MAMALSPCSRATSRLAPPRHRTEVPCLPLHLITFIDLGLSIGTAPRYPGHDRPQPILRFALSC
jgi:hypothetical protein